MEIHIARRLSECQSQRVNLSYESIGFSLGTPTAAALPHTGPDSLTRPCWSNRPFEPPQITSLLGRGRGLHVLRKQIAPRVIVHFRFERVPVL
jgi:hypothetical protein